MAIIEAISTQTKSILVTLPQEVMMTPTSPKIIPKIALLSTWRRKIKIEINTSNIGTVPSRIAAIPLSKAREERANKVKGKAELKNPTIA